MRRKIVQQGHGTKVVSIPINWTKKYNLQKGDEIEMEIIGDKIILRPAEIKVPEQEIILDSEHIKPNEWRCIIYLIKAGHNNIKLFGKKQELEKIKWQIIEKFPGFDVIDEKPNYIIFRNISSEEVNYSIYERKCFLVTLDMMDNLIEYVKKKKFDEMEDILKLEMLNDKFTNVCERYLNKRGDKNYAFRWNNIWELEKICDQLKLVCGFIAENKLGLSKEVLDYFEEIKSYFTKYYEVYYKFDIDKIFSFIDNKKGLTEKGKKLFFSKTKNESMIISYLMNIVDMISNSLGNTVGINEDKLVQRQAFK